MINKLHTVIKSKEFTILASLVTVFTAGMLSYNAYYSVQLAKKRIEAIKQKGHE